MGKNMYNLNKFILIVAIFSIFTNLYGSRKPHITKEKIGQKYYLKRCSSCHGSGNRGGNLYSISEWKENFNNNGKELIELHDGEDNVQNVIKYIKSNSFKKESEKMLKFIQEFAYDSETIPTCY
jgi:hypothetical protein